MPIARKMLVNYDKPTRHVTLHYDDCTYVQTWLNADTYKPAASSLDDLHQDGGWLDVPSAEEGRAIFEKIQEIRARRRWRGKALLPPTWHICSTCH